MGILEMKTYFVYKTLNIITGQFYIGAHGGTLDDGDVRDRALQVSTAKHLLGIGGLSPVKRVEARTQTTHLTADDIRGLVAEARELGMCVRNDEDVIDIESEELQTGT